LGRDWSSIWKTDTEVIPKEYVLSNAYLNSFNHRVSIPFALPLSSNVVISIYNIMRQIVKTLTKAQLSLGNHSVQWNSLNDAGEKVPSGMYIVKMNAIASDGKNSFNKSQKIVLLK